MTLHTLLNLNGHCAARNIHLNVAFVNDNSAMQKYIKQGERLVWFDYATNIDEGSIIKCVQPFDKGVQVLVFPSVKEEINWKMFKEKTLAGSTEPVSQRGLVFDTNVGRKLYDNVYEVTDTSARVWAMDCRPVDKKLRADKVPVKLPVFNSEEMFQKLKSLGVKIGALSTATVICHYTYECLGNILETGGIELNA
jgi:hypothetical protein